MVSQIIPLGYHIPRAPVGAKQALQKFLLAAQTRQKSLATKYFQLVTTWLQPRTK